MEPLPTALSPRATATLSNMLDAQRTALSVAEHNARVRADEQAALARYTDIFNVWAAQRLQALVEAMSNPGLVSAKVLTSAEVKQSIEGCSRIQLGHSHFADLLTSHGIELTLAGAIFRRAHRLLLSAYTTRGFQVMIGAAQPQKRDPVDPGIMFVPYYFAEKNWRAFFSRPAGSTGQQGGIVGTYSPRAFFGGPTNPNAMPPFDPQTLLCHQTSAGRWPEDADDYNRVTDAAVERLLDRIQHWSTASSYGLDL
jgi:hypothetical protein